MKKRGFTLIEIMLVVAIMGILAAMVMPKLTGRTKEAKNAVARSDVKVSIPLALDLYELDIGSFPSTLEHLLDNKDGKEEWKGPYLKAEPKDPWSNPYMYKFPAEQSKYGYDLFSNGADEQSGTNDDISNW